ncbi:sigma E protease regulator RseP [Pantoea sp. Aalb]|uniref:sigma E protease regulator RseP n=1 Tax=Pantoea sp. Aalb TaxID=2576762 RepID=UPI00132A2940|nr:sigma E protease regulator RseP [Pantoea sp. Aalb]MXP67222.1 sigma E protease regulator RseP [Pantoea sp. Aalb]
MLINIIWNYIFFILALIILSTVHEFAHFKIARLYGVHVECFSIGFGKKIYSYKDSRGTEYIIAWILFGGYIKMLEGYKENLSIKLYRQTFNSKTILQRATIIFAGPIANLLFAIFIYWGLFIYGIPHVRPVIGEVINGSISAKAQITPGMEIKAIDDIETPDWNSIYIALISKINSKKVIFTVSQSIKNITITKKKELNLKNWRFNSEQQDLLRTLGITPLSPKIKTTLANVQENSPASIAGLRAGDIIVAVNNKPLNDWQTFAKQVLNNPGKNMLLTINRSGQFYNIKLIPKAKKENPAKGFVGIIPCIIPIPDHYKIVKQYDFFTALNKASMKIFQLMKLVVSVISKLLLGDIKLDNLSGPISIAQSAGLSAKYGVVDYLIFLALISVNLSIMNLLPLPVLDGGHLLFLVFEKINGRPVSKQVQAFSYRIGLLMLILLTGLAFFNDFSRL